ncbi:SGNH/GDSL hydrolase family protein [Candidatus Daviesbacteria bacterium]|nr:SGNH/GDSL hydrolase family protein [Candidatus Daviesbacteria bacterium]
MLSSKKIFLLSSTFIFGFLALILFSIPKISLFIEKHSIKPPPPYKTLAEVKGISTIVPSSVSGKLKYPHDYTLVLVGDSMTALLGNADELRGYLNEYYPNKTFEVLNYGFGSTNILSVPDRLTKTTFYQRDFRPITDIDFDLTILESFGYNPLSNLPLQEGLKKQTETLDTIVDILTKDNKRSNLVFLATIAPNSSVYGAGKVDLNPEQKKQWTKERVAYIKNHINYAKTHNIPLIDVFDKSIDSNGEGKLIYINTTDHIHPSPTGILLISKTIADFIAQNKLLPNI